MDSKKAELAVASKCASKVGFRCNPYPVRHVTVIASTPTVSSSIESRDNRKTNCQKQGDKVLVKPNTTGQSAVAKNGLKGLIHNKTVDKEKLKTNNDIGELPAISNACPPKLDANSGVTYKQTKMDQKIHETVIFKLVDTQQQEILRWKKKYEDEIRCRTQERKLRDSLRADLEGQLRTNTELQGKLAKAEIKITQLQKKLQLTEITTQKLRRRSSENFQTVAKCRAMMLAVQEAHNTTEVKQEAEKWSAIFSNIVREQHQEINDLQRQLGLSRAESDISEAQSESLNTLDTSMFDVTPVGETTEEGKP